MSTEFKCPRCGGAMIEGLIIDRGSFDVSRKQAWIAGEPQPAFMGGFKTLGKEAYTIQTFRCGSCNYLESYAKEKIYL